MSNTFSLDDIRAAAEKQYADVEITFGDITAVLHNPLRLAKAKRDKLIGLQDRLDAASKGTSDEDQADLLAESLKLVAYRNGPELVAEIDGDLTVLAAVFQHYTKGTQAGEA